MTDNNDPLRDLWQQQEVVKFDLAKLKKQWRKIRYKQYFYVFLDLVPVLAMPFLLWFSYSETEQLVFISFVVICVIGTVFSAYIIWLRRYSFRAKFESTSHYLESIGRQYKQNIKIAQAAKYSTIAIPPIFIVMYGGFYLADTFEWERLVRKVLYSGVTLAISLPIMWLWADRRINKFKKELVKLESQIE